MNYHNQLRKTAQKALSLKCPKQVLSIYDVSILSVLSHRYIWRSQHLYTFLLPAQLFLFSCRLPAQEAEGRVECAQVQYLV